MTNRESLMRKIQMYAFTAHECVLYLDCHPNNKKALEKHKKAVSALNEAVANYESVYGPLTANASHNENGFDWVNGTWPWQNYQPKEEN